MALPGCPIPIVGKKADVLAVIGQTFRFVLVGIINTLIGIFSIYSILYLFKTTPVVANAIGFAIGFFVSFTLNRHWTFSDEAPITKSLPRYLIMTIVAYLLNLLVIVIGMRTFGIGPYLIQLFGIGVYSVSMFIGLRWFVFSSVIGSKIIK